MTNVVDEDAWLRLANGVLDLAALPPGVKWRDGHTENISRSGVLFTTSEPVAKLTVIEMLLTLPTEVGGGEHATVICRGRVVRTEPARETDFRSTVAATIAGFRLAHWYTNDPRRI